MPLMPERVKYRKMHRGNRAGLATRGHTVAFGEYGEGFVRIGLVENEHRIRQAARNVKKFLDRSGQILSGARERVPA